MGMPAESDGTYAVDNLASTLELYCFGAAFLHDAYGGSDRELGIARYVPNGMSHTTSARFTPRATHAAWYIIRSRVMGRVCGVSGHYVCGGVADEDGVDAGGRRRAGAMV